MCKLQEIMDILGQISYLLAESSDEETDDDLHELIESSSSSESSEDEEICHVVITDFMDTIQNYSEMDFKSHFRMYRNNAQWLIDIYSTSPFIPSTDHGRRARVGPEKEIYTYLWYVANTITFRQLGNLFGIARSTAWMVVRRVTQWILSIGDEFVRWPQGAAAEDVKQKFLLKCRMPGVIGAIDCTHVTIRAPISNKADYFDRNRKYSMVIQAVVDMDKRFLNLFVGEPGSLHDSRVLRRSQLFNCATNYQQDLFPANSFLLGDSAYQSSSWIVTPFKNYGGLPNSKIAFNKIHSSGRIVVENAFGLVKTRFRRIQFFTEQTDLKEIANTIMAICILNNICISLNDQMDEIEMEEVDDDEDTEETSTNEATDRREELFQYLLSNGIII